MKPARFAMNILLVTTLSFTAASLFAQPAETDPAFARAQLYCELRHCDVTSKRNGGPARRPDFRT